MRLKGAPLLFDLELAAIARLSPVGSGRVGVAARDGRRAAGDPRAAGRAGPGTGDPCGRMIAECGRPGSENPRLRVSTAVGTTADARGR